MTSHHRHPSRRGLLLRPAPRRLGGRLRVCHRVHGHRPRRPDPQADRRRARRDAEPGVAAVHQLHGRDGRRDADHRRRVRRGSEPKRTLLTGLALIIVFSALAGLVGHHRRASSASAPAGASATPCSSRPPCPPSCCRPAARPRRRSSCSRPPSASASPPARCSAAQLGSISWRAPFFGVAVLMTIALVATAFLLPATPPHGRRTSLADPFRALRYPGLLTLALTALFYNMGFFTLLAFTPFPLRHDGAPGRAGLLRLGHSARDHLGVGRARCSSGAIGSVPTVLDLALAVRARPRRDGDLDRLARPCSWSASIVAGAFLGVNNTVITEAVMGAAPVERPVASAAYSFVRFSGGAIAPYAAGKLGENVSIHAPFWIGAAAVAVGRRDPRRRLPLPPRRPAAGPAQRGRGRGGAGRRPRLTGRSHGPGTIGACRRP